MIAMDSESVVSALTRVIEDVVRDHNRMWSEGVISEDSRLRHVEEALSAVQYAPHYEDGVWRARSGSEWLEGTSQAAAASRGQGWAWSVHDLNVLPRSEQEAVAAYRIVHTWGQADRRPAQAFFLETWRRGADGRWRLARHTAEKI
jgi:hypothetical protein